MIGGKIAGGLEVLFSFAQRTSHHEGDAALDVQTIGLRNVMNADVQNFLAQRIVFVFQAHRSEVDIVVFRLGLKACRGAQNVVRLLYPVGL